MLTMEFRQVATAPFQLALQSRAGTDAVGQAVRLLTDVDQTTLLFIGWHWQIRSLEVERIHATTAGPRDTCGEIMQARPT